MRVEYAAAAGTEHVPAEIEQAEPGGMQEAGNHLLFVEAGPAREFQQVDAVERAILALLDQIPDRIDDAGIGGLPQHRKQSLGFTHGAGLKVLDAARSQTSASDPAGWGRRRPAPPVPCRAA